MTPYGANDRSMKRIFRLLCERARSTRKLPVIMHRPMASGYSSGWIASQVFDIELELTATAMAIDGRSRGESDGGKGPVSRYEAASANILNWSWYTT